MIIVHKDESNNINEIQLVVEDRAFITIPLFEKDPWLKLGKYLTAYRIFDATNNYTLIENENGNVTETTVTFMPSEMAEIAKGMKYIVEFNEIAPFYNLPEISKR